MPGHNRVAGLDLLTEPTDTLRVEAFGMHSTTDAAPSDWAGRVGFNYEGNTNRAYFFHLYVGDAFRHDLGFVRREDIGLSFGKYEKVFRPDFGSRWIREHTLGVAVEAVQDSGYQELQTRIANFRYSLQLQDGGVLAVEYDDTYDLLTEPFEIHRPVGLPDEEPGVIVPEGMYNYGEVVATFQSNQSAALSGDIEFTKGSFWSGERRTVGGGLRVRFSEHLAVSGSLERNDVDLPEGAFETHLETMRLDWSFSPRMFLNAFVQYNSDTDTWLSNVRFNFIHHPLSDLFIVWNETHGPDTKLRSLIVKYTHMFSL